MDDEGNQTNLTDNEDDDDVVVYTVNEILKIGLRLVGYKKRGLSRSLSYS
jgi:hypothetical protein